MKVSIAVALAVVASAVFVPPSSRTVQAQEPGRPEQVVTGPPAWASSQRRDTSRPLREMPAQAPVSTREDFTVKQAPPEAQGGQAGPPIQADQAIQSFALSPLAAVNGVSFDGVGEGNPQFSYNVNLAPPDTTGEAGLTQYVQWVNTSFAIFDKATGAILYGPAAGRTIWTGFGGDCEARNDGDPIVQYDQLADRWIMTQFALQSGNYLQCVAVSQTSDATGAWHRYAFSYSEFPDYPKLAVWPDAYYITFNMFGTAGFMFTGGRVCAYDRARMLDGLSAIQVCYQIGYPSLLASDLEGKTLPPTGTPNYVMNRGSNALLLWKFKPNFVTPASSTFTGPTSIPVSAFTPACSRQCVPQPNTSQLLDVLGDRLMYRLSYRNLGSREALMVNHSVVAGSVTGIRWYELNITGGVPSVRQQSTFAPDDGQHRWMGSVAMDQVGNMAVGYTIGSGTMKPSISFAGREADDPLNMLGLDNSIKAGTGSQLTTLSRWGDYSTMAVDPVDDCTFWYTSEYLQGDGTFNWSTRIASFKFSSCEPVVDPPMPDFSLGASPSGRTVTQGQSTTFGATVTAANGYTGGGSFSVTGLPANASGSFSPASFSGGSGSATLNVTTAANTPTGSFPLTIKAEDTSGTPVHTAVVTLTVNAPAGSDFSITASPGNRNIKRGQSGKSTVTVTPVGGFAADVALSVAGCPSSAQCVFSQSSVNGGGSSTLTVSLGSSVAKGTFTLMITGASGAISHNATVEVRVR